MSAASYRASSPSVARSAALSGSISHARADLVFGRGGGGEVADAGLCRTKHARTRLGWGPHPRPRYGKGKSELTAVIAEHACVLASLVPSPQSIW